MRAKNQSRRRDWRFIVLGTLTLVAVVFIGAWIHGNTSPPIVIPPKIAPVPNAFDTFKSAAAMSTSSTPKSGSFESLTEADIASYQQTIDNNKGALDMLRSGFQDEYLDTSLRSPATMYPYFAGFRNLARVLAMESAVKERSGDLEGSVNSALDAVQLGEMCPRGATIIGELVGVACQAIGRRPVWKSLANLDGPQCKRLAARYEKIMAMHVPITDSLTEEKYLGEQTLMLLFRSTGAVQQMANPSPGGSGGGMSATLLSNLYFMVHSKTKVLHLFQGYMDQVIDSSRKPYDQAKVPVPVPNDQFVQIMSPSFDQVILKDFANSRTQNGILLVAIALQGYHADHKRYPDTLQQLVPEYLPALPADPFATNGSFRYHLDAGDQYTMYSIGPNGIDDGGRVIDNPSKSTKTSPYARYQIEKDSKGDIVAGKNIY